MSVTAPPGPHDSAASARSPLRARGEESTARLHVFPRAALLGVVVPLALVRVPASGMMRSMTVVAESEGPVHLGTGRTVVPLATRGKASLGERFARLPRGRRWYLLVKGLVADDPPGVLYAAHLGVPAEPAPTPGDPKPVGLVHFFDARRPGARNEDGTPNRDATKVFFSFDVTEAARALHARGALAARLNVTLIPEGTPQPAANTVVGRIQIVEQ